MRWLHFVFNFITYIAQLSKGDHADMLCCCATILLSPEQKGNTEYKYRMLKNLDFISCRQISVNLIAKVQKGV